jgi:BED zinc finger
MSLRIRSSAWLFFDKTSDPSIAKCSLCGSSIKSHNSTTNLLKHLRSRHFEETSTEINWESSSADNFDDQSTDIPSASVMSEEKVEELNEISMPFEMIDNLLSTSTPYIARSGSPAWYCFTKVKDENQAKCKFCSSLLGYNESSGTTNLLNHFMHKHEQIYQQVFAEVRCLYDKLV